jgi:hemerythrin-like domain-containing protein
VAKRTTRKQAGRKAARPRATAKRRPAAARTRAKGKNAASRRKPPARKPVSTRARTAAVVRRKTAARAAAARSLKRSPAPKPQTTLESAATAVRGAVAGAVAAVAKRLPGAPAATDAISLLERDHRRMEDLLKRGAETTERAVKARGTLLDTITSELNLHELIEETVLYPALQPHAATREVVVEGYQEHHVADLLIQELHDVARDNEVWGAKFKVFKENIEHHIQEEERAMFPAARAVLSAEELQALGARMTEMKAEAGRRA